jgi:hypothetical protein
MSAFTATEFTPDNGDYPEVDNKGRFDLWDALKVNPVMILPPLEEEGVDIYHVGLNFFASGDTLPEARLDLRRQADNWFESIQRHGSWSLDAQDTARLKCCLALINSYRTGIQFAD